MTAAKLDPEVCRAMADAITAVPAGRPPMSEDYRPGQHVIAQLSPGSPIWTEVVYLGRSYLPAYHRVQINADRHTVPSHRIRRMP